jgi:hypothetical protein
MVRTHDIKPICMPTSGDLDRHKIIKARGTLNEKKIFSLYIY